MTTSWRDDEHLVDLLVKEATEGLTPAEIAELARLSQHLPEGERTALQSTVAAVWIAADVPREKMPASLRNRIVSAAPGSARSNVGASPANTGATEVRQPTGARRPNEAPPAAASGSDELARRREQLRASAATQPISERRGSKGYSAAGWWAAAACLVLAVAGWWPRLVGEAVVQQVALSPEQQRAALLSSGRALEASWSEGPATAGTPVVGDVVFDPVSQRGFLRFRGIPANDPRLAQYQLWIADSGRPQPEPVDGGVFDVAKSTSNLVGDVIIPFEAKLPVGKPAAFVVTLEQPGGVVVSRQERVMALAKVAERGEPK